MKRGVAGKIAVVAWDSSAQDFRTGDEANITTKLSKDGAAVITITDANPTEISGITGVYVFDVTATETDADLLVLRSVSSTPNVVIQPVIIYTS
jgi:hypothetical protein